MVCSGPSTHPSKINHPSLVLKVPATYSKNWLLEAELRGPRPQLLAVLG